MNILVRTGVCFTTDRSKTVVLFCFVLLLLLLFCGCACACVFERERETEREAESYCGSLLRGFLIFCPVVLLSLCLMETVRHCNYLIWEIVFCFAFHHLFSFIYGRVSRMLSDVVCLFFHVVLLCCNLSVVLPRHLLY